MSSPSKTSYLSLLDGLRRREDLLRIFIFTLVTVFVWIGSEIYLSQTQTKVVEDFQKYIAPLNPNIDRQVLQEIQNRRGFSQEELESFALQQPLPTPQDEELNEQTEVAPELVTEEIEEEELVVTPTPSPSPEILL